MAYNDTRNPLRALQKRIGARVMLRLKNGTQYTGDLKEWDSYMNLILENVEEKLNDNEPVQKYNELFIRGNNLLFVKPNGD